MAGVQLQRAVLGKVADGREHGLGQRCPRVGLGLVDAIDQRCRVPGLQIAADGMDDPGTVQVVVLLAGIEHMGIGFGVSGDHDAFRGGAPAVKGHGAKPHPGGELLDHPSGFGRVRPFLHTDKPPRKGCVQLTDKATVGQDGRQVVDFASAKFQVRGVDHLGHLNGAAIRGHSVKYA